MATRAGETLVVHGYKEFLRACARAERETKLYVRETFREVGEVVRVEAQTLFNPYDSKSAAGYRVRVRQAGVAVEQSLGKTTGRRPDWGAKQMRDALLPAIAEKQGVVEHKFEEAIDRVADHFDDQ